MLNPGDIVDRYRVRTRIGEGGMAVVYLVRHQSLQTSHALKVHTSTKLNIKRRFAREGRLQARLHHPNVVQVTDVIDLGERAGLVMEYVQGPSMSGLLRRFRPPLPDCVALFRGLAEGMGHAHEQGLVHRDLKPSNVLIDLRGGRMRAKITDFGLAKSLIEHAEVRTRTGATLGTPSYMSPEQIRDASKVDHRADIYGLGCLLYTLCCGRPPFRGSDVVELMERIEDRAYTDPRARVHAMPDRLADLIGDLLHPDPDARPQDVGQLLDRLDDALIGRIGEQTVSIVRALKEEQAQALAIIDAQIARSELSGGTAGPLPRTLIAAPDPQARCRIRAAAQQVGLQPDVTPDAPRALTLLLQAVAETDRYTLVIVDDGARGGLLEKRVARDPRLRGVRLVRADQIPGDATAMARVLGTLIHPRAAQTEVTPEGPVHRGTALVVEDHHVQRALLAHVLRRLHHTVVEAKSLAEAADVVGRTPVDVVIIDVHLPDGDGLSLIERMRAEGDMTPVLVLTADADPDLRARATDVDDVVFLMKPARAREVEAALKRLRSGGRAGGSPVVDPGALDNLAEMLDDEEVLYRLIDLFLDDMASERYAWSTAMKSEDRGRVSELAHRLQPAASHLGAVALVDACAELMNLSTEVAWTTVEARIDELMVLIDKTAHALRRLRARRLQRAS